jgi:hypothetical protein
MFCLRYLLSLAAFAMIVISGGPSRGETIIDEWQNVKAHRRLSCNLLRLIPRRRRF